MNTRDESEFVVVVVKNRDSGRFDNIVTMLPHDHVRERGLVPEAMVGSLTVSLGDGGTIEPSNFVENPAFVDYLQRFIAGHAVPTSDDVVAARQHGETYIYVLDQRTPTPNGEVRSEDIFGGFEVTEEGVSADSYRANPKHRILTNSGFFQLHPESMIRLRRNLENLSGDQVSSESS